MSAKLSQRLARLLNLVPYFLANPGISAADAAAELGISTGQLMNDLNQLWMCGLPGYGPGDLIDLSFSEDSIEVTFTAGIERPLRLTSIEATALLVALRSIVDMPGMVDPTAAHGAMAKIEAAAGAAARLHSGSTLDGTELREDPHAATVRSALVNGHALRLVYYSATRDRVSERIVDPMRIVLVDNHSYLQAWCRNAEGVRLFRFDRIDEAVELDQPARPPASAVAGLELFDSDSALPVARLRITPGHAWALDHYPMDQQAVDESGNITATMRFATLEWMTRLALGFGAGVTVVAPAELADAVTHRATQALAAYEAL